MTALQCFEAAARHLSFTRAAEELHLTQSAVSKQVAQLEEMLCHNLFERVRQRLYLSPAGSLYLAEVHKILTQVDISSRYILTYGGETEVLRIATQPTFGARWLVPRLKGFGDRYPRIHLDIRNELEPFDRQLFGGIVGWCDDQGNGEWVVTIRCGKVNGNRVRLFAGAGIVPASSPESEWRETGVKLNTMLQAFGLN